MQNCHKPDFDKSVGYYIMTVDTTNTLGQNLFETPSYKCNTDGLFGRDVWRSRLSVLVSFQVALDFEVGSVVVHEAVDDESTTVTCMIDSCCER